MAYISRYLYYLVAIWLADTALAAVPTAAPSSVRSTSNEIVTVAGTGTRGSTGTGEPSVLAAIGEPRRAYVDTSGTMYLMEKSSLCVRKFSTVDGNGIMTLFAGVCGSGGPSSDGGAATSAFLSSNGNFLTGDTTGNIYIADDSRVRLVPASGIISTVVGNGISGKSGDGGKATSASISNVDGLWVNSVGVLFAVTYDNMAVCAISASGIITLYAGSYTSGFLGDGGAATSGRLETPEGLGGDSTGRLYIADSGNLRFRTVSPNGIISTIAGDGTSSYYGENVAATSAGFVYPLGMDIDSSNGDLYMSDYFGNRVFIRTGSSALVSTYAGTGDEDSYGDGGAPTAAALNRPASVSMSTTGMLFVSELSGYRVRAMYSIAPTNAPTPAPSHVRSSVYSIASFAGVDSDGTTSGASGGAATSTVFGSLRFITQDTAGNLYVSEQKGNCVRQITPAGIVNDYAGVCNNGGSYDGDDGKATSATYYNVVACFADTVGHVYSTDYGGAHVRVVSLDGIIANFAGNGDSSYGYGDGEAATSAGLNPHGIWGDSVGNIFIATYGQNQIRKVDGTDGIVTLFAGTGDAGSDGDAGPAVNAVLNGPYCLGGDTAGAIYVSDYNNNRVRKIDASGIITAFIGTGDYGPVTDGTNAVDSQFESPAGIAIDGDNGDVFVSSRDISKIFVVTGSTGLISTLAGGGTVSAADTSNGDGGLATAAAFTYVDGIYLNSAGYMYVNDFGLNRVRILSPGAPPTLAPSAVPTTIKPTSDSTLPPTIVPSVSPSIAPSAKPTVAPTITPTVLPTVAPTRLPTVSPTFKTIPIQSSSNFKVTNANAFAGLTSDGGVVTWGSSSTGGDSTSVSSSLTSGVVSVVSSKNAFAAVKSDGSVVAWGRSAEIAGWVAYATSSSGVVSMVATEQAFAGVTSSGGVVAFGAGCCGGSVNQYGTSSYLTSDVKSISASAGAFCALKTDGSVYCWGSAFAGGGVSSVSRSDIAGVVLMAASRSSFAVMTSSGSVIAWGEKNAGGVIPLSVSSELTSVVHILSSEGGFAAYTTDDELHSWGYADDVSGVSDVEYVAHTSNSFCAIKSDGSATAWGDSTMGGDAVSVSSQLVDVSSVSASSGAFAAVTSSGTVVAWGDVHYGGQLFANVSSSMSEIQSVVATKRAFAALSSSGGVTVWGATYFGGVMSSDVSSNLQSGVALICANDVAFTAIKSDGTAYAWGYEKSVATRELSGDFSSIVSC